MSYSELMPNAALRRYLERGERELVVLDVRTPPEWRGGHIPGAVHIPLDELPARWQDLDPDRDTLVVCAHGIRSAAAGQWLVRLGFSQVYNLRHGMSGWDGPVERDEPAGSTRASPGMPPPG